MTDFILFFIHLVLWGNSGFHMSCNCYSM